MEKEYTLTVATAESFRLDKYISMQVDDLSRAYIQKLIEDNKIQVNGKSVKSHTKVNEGDYIHICIPAPEVLEVKAEVIPLDIVYEDEYLLVVNKPQGMVVHPAQGNYTGTLVNALMTHCEGKLSAINGVIRPGIVHRIDKDTSGLLLVAKDNQVHIGLAEQIKAHTLTRKYIAIVHGHIKNDKGTINMPIGRHSGDRKKMAATHKNSKEAVTHFTVLERLENFTYVECVLETGRTHQIRVHMSEIGHPIVGDPVYGPKKNHFHLKGQALHAKVVGFFHPIFDKNMAFEAPPPPYFVKLRDQLCKK